MSFKEDPLSKRGCVQSLGVSLPFSPPSAPVSSELLVARGSRSNEQVDKEAAASV